MRLTFFSASFAWGSLILTAVLCVSRTKCVACLSMRDLVIAGIGARACGVLNGLELSRRECWCQIFLYFVHNATIPPDVPPTTGMT